MDTSADEDGKRVSAMIDHTQQMGGVVDHLNIMKLEYLFKLNSTARNNDPAAKLQIDERVSLLRSVSLFKKLHTVDLTQIALVAEERSLSTGSVLAQQGEQGDELFIIVSGKVSVRVSGGDSVEKEVACRCAGDYVGEMAVIHDEVRMASLVAIEDVSILALSQANFRKILRDRPETSVAVTRVLAERLIEAAEYNTKTKAASAS
jgi:CRP-like cAMP-binding protein